MKMIRTYLMMAAMAVLTYFGTIQEVVWANNLASFFTICLLLIYIMTASDYVMKAIADEHASVQTPAWVDNLFYLTMVTICAAKARWLFAAAWVVIWAFDSRIRKEINKRHAE